MFCTIINDAYKKEDAMKIAIALDYLCSPRDGNGWASNGIYCYWDYYTKEILYIGLAVDLRERFKQHNGLIKVKESSTKNDEINKYFEEKEILGFSIFVQSPLSQPYIKSKSEKITSEDLRGEDRDDHKITEGILLESYKMVHGKLPLWNKNRGSKEGHKRAISGNYEIIRGFTANKFTPQDFHPLVARSTIRELSKNEKYFLYENNFLFSVRFEMLYLRFNFNEALKFAFNVDTLDLYPKIVGEGYLFKELIFYEPMILITEKPSDISDEFTTLNFKFLRKNI